MKKTLFKDVLLSTVFVFICIFLFRFIVVNAHFLDPIKNALKDFEVLDLALTEFEKQNNTGADTNIVIINIGELDRKGISVLLNTINEFQPKVVGLDVTFNQLKDPETDSMLAYALKNTPNLVKASLFEYEGEHISSYSGLMTSHPKFNIYGENAFVNFVSAEKENTIRYFIPHEIYKGKKIDFFSTALAGKYLPENPVKSAKYKDPKPELIHYKGNRENFIVFEPDDINDSNENLNVIRNKIVMIGFMGVDKDKPELEDLHFTPMNPKYSGRSFPDMYGIVIHANIVSMILKHDQIKEIPRWLMYIISFIFCLLHMYFFIKYYVHRHLWFHLFFKAIQLVTSVLVVGISLYLFIYNHIRLDTSALLIPIILTVDLLYFYDAIVKALHNKFGYKTIFIYHKIT